MKILLVDDDAFLRDMYATKFSASGYDIDSAETGDQAITKLEQDKSFDVVLLDMVMPGVTGPELITKIKETLPDRDIKCIVLSNQGQESDIEEAKSAGAIGYIIKAEAIPSDVVARVDKLINNK